MKRIPIKKAVLAMVAPLLVSLRKVSFILNDKYRTTAEKKIIIRIRANTMAIIVRSIDISFYLFGFSHSITVFTVSSIRLMVRMPSRKVL